MVKSTTKIQLARNLRNKMIQRIQSFWLLMSTGLMVSFFYSPLGTFSTLEGTFESAFFKTTALTDLLLLNSPLTLTGIFCILSAIFTFLGIFFFKKRNVQLRLTRYAMTLKSLIFCGLGVAYYLVVKEGAATVTLEMGLLIPFIALVFDFMALKAIKSDEELVKSINRIR